MINAENWMRGLTIGDYVNQMDVYQKELKTRLRDTRITPSECQRVRSLPGELRVAVLTEAWCLDSLMNLPLLVKMADCSDQIEIRIFIRSQFAQLQGDAGQSGYDKIPLFIFMDHAYQIKGYWMERPFAANRMIAEWKDNHPQFSLLSDAARENPEIDQPEFGKLKHQLMDEMWNWYDTSLQSETIKEILAVLQ